MARKGGPIVKASWDRHAVHTFCDLCIREIETGNRPGTHLTRDGWSNVISKFEKETGRAYDRYQLKSKWDMLKKDWKQWKLMLENEPKIKWNLRKDTIHASNEWWEEKIKVMPEARRFRVHGIDAELEQKLDKMFTVVGDLDEYAPVPSDATDLACSQKHEPARKRKSSDHAFSQDNSEKMELVVDPIPSEPTKKCPKVEVVVAPETRLINWADRVPDACSITDAIRALDSIGDVPKASPLYYFAIKLILDRDKREVFMALKPEIKAWWLKMEEQETRK